MFYGYGNALALLGLRLEEAFNIVHDIIHQAVLLCLWTRKAKCVTLRGFLAPNGKTLTQFQHPPWPGGGCGGGGDFFFAAVGLDQGLDQGGPLGVEALAACFLQDLHDQVGEAAAQGGGEAEEAVFGQVFGGGEEAV